jgi:hypothetical protein
MYFLSILQRPASAKSPIEKDESLYAGALVVQTERPVNQMAAIAQRTLASINPNLTVVKFQTFDQQIADRFTEERMVARLTTLFGALALLLATVGLYGVTAYTAARRTGEIGIRMALGAARSGVIAMVMRGAMIETALGVGDRHSHIIALRTLCRVATVRYEGHGCWRAGDVDSHAGGSCISRGGHSRTTGRLDRSCASVED